MNNRIVRMAMGLGAAGIAAASLLWSAPASACGGFFCNNQTMDQTAEEILFGVDPATGRVRAIIRIFFQGDAKDFAWVLPLPSVPDLGVGSEAVFTVLRNRTRPSFRLELDPDSQNCLWRSQPWPASADFADEDGGASPPGAVEVLKSGQVGSFEYSVVKSDDPDALFAWLNDNDFVQPPIAQPLIASYVAQDMVFVALKLKQDAGTGDITPVVLDFEEQAPCVPLVLTQIAAAPDMPVRLWVASPERAVPKNWMEVVPNPKKIDWLNNGSNYEQLVGDAIDEAAGRAFVTDYAGSTNILSEAFYQDGQYDLSKLKAASSAQQWVTLTKSQFASSPALLAIFQKVVPLPAAAQANGIDEQSFYNWEDSYSEYYAQIDFNAEQATALLEERIVKPLMDAQELVDRHKTLTRLITIVSPEEMTRDPLFAFNPDLPEVPLERVAKGSLLCGDSGIEDATIELPGGDTFKPNVPSWWSNGAGVQGDDLSQEPNASSIRLLPTSGPAVEVSAELVDYVDKQLNTKTADLVIADLAGGNGGGANQPGGGGSGGTNGSVERTSGGCSSAPASGTAAGGAVALLLAGLALFRRRL